MATITELPAIIVKTLIILIFIFLGRNIFSQTINLDNYILKNKKNITLPERQFHKVIMYYNNGFWFLMDASLFIKDIKSTWTTILTDETTKFISKMEHSLSQKDTVIINALLTDIRIKTITNSEFANKLIEKNALIKRDSGAFIRKITVYKYRERPKTSGCIISGRFVFVDKILIFDKQELISMPRYND